MPNRRAGHSIATQDDVSRAIDELSDADNLRLGKYAQRLLWGFKEKTSWRNEEDLLSEAVVSVFAGTRKWEKEKVGFVTLLMGAMRSIASHWYEGYDIREGSVQWARRVPEDGGEEADPICTAIATTPNPERITIANESTKIAREAIKRLRELYEGDSLALDVFDGFRADMSPLEIQEALGISRTEFETVRRRILRKANKHMRGEGCPMSQITMNKSYER